MKKIVFLGDSITDAFHKMNVDEEKLGNGYVKIISEKLKEKKNRFLSAMPGTMGSPCPAFCACLSMTVCSMIRIW